MESVLSEKKSVVGRIHKTGGLKPEVKEYKGVMDDESGESTQEDAVTGV